MRVGILGSGLMGGKLGKLFARAGHENVKPWHGATPDSWFVHIAIGTNAQKGEAEWLEPVTDEEYNNLK